MIPHSFAKIGKGEGKLLMFFQPAGKMEEMFKKIAAGVTKNLSEEEQDKFREEHGLKRVGPQLRTSRNGKSGHPPIFKSARPSFESMSFKLDVSMRCPSISSLISTLR